MRNLVANLRKNPGILMYLLALAGMTAMWVAFRSVMNFGRGMVLPAIVMGVGEAAFFLWPYWLLPPKWRWSVMLPVWGMAIWILSNLCYFRFWNDFYPPSTIFISGNYDSEILGIGFSLIEPGDWIFFAAPVLVTVCALIVGIKGLDRQKFSGKMKLVALGLSLVLVVAAQICYVMTDNREEKGERIGLTQHYMGASKFTISRTNDIDYTGLSGCLPKFISEWLSIYKTLTDDERKEIDSFLANYRYEGAIVGDTVSANVVYIIVESLNREVLGMEFDSKPVAPTLDSLAVAEGTVCFRAVATQIKHSVSSDGHLLLLTGLLPPSDFSYTAYVGGRNLFPSLPKGLDKHENLMILGDEGNLWNEKEVFGNFGFERVLTRLDYATEDDGLTRDEALFREARNQLGQRREPFLLGLMTMSMHYPFTDAKEIPEFISRTELPEITKRYLATVNRFDSLLKEFLAALPRNTIVFIASDHPLHDIKVRDEHPLGVFMALHTDRTATVKRWVGQANLFPATLDILGLELPDGYRGLMPSALNPNVIGTINGYGSVYGVPTKETKDTLREAYRVSDLILRGDYFRP